MYKIINLTLSLIFLLYSSLFSQNGESDRLLGMRIDSWSNSSLNFSDSVSYKYNDELLVEELGLSLKSSGWEVKNRLTYSYDICKNNINKIKQNWNGSAWINIDKYTYGYDYNRNKNLRIKQDWNGSAWINIDKFVYSNDHCGNILKINTTDWDDEWINKFEVEYSYNESILNSELYKSWSILESNWVNRHRFFLKRNDNGNLTEKLRENWNSSTLTWELKHQFLRTYDANENLTSYLWIKEINSEWINIDQQLYEYDGNDNLILYTEQSWKDSSWVNDYREISEFDNDNNIISKTFEEWDDSLSHWQTKSRQLLKYDYRNNLIELLNQKPEGTNWINSNRFLYYYDTKIKEENITFELSNIIPNPNNGCFKIVFDENLKSEKKILLYDLNGKFILQRVCASSKINESFNLNYLPSGIYFINVEIDDQIEIKKIMIYK